MSKTPKSSFSIQNSYFRSKFFFDQNLDFALGDDLIAHFGLICDRGHLVPVLGSALFFGGAFGVLLFSWLSDKIGRGLTLRIILVGMVLSNVCAVFAQGIYMYIAAKAFVGLCGISGGSVVYAYFSEVSGGEVAKKCGTNGSNGGYAVGLLFLVGLGMWTQNWRTMEVVICAIGLIICIASFFLPESPRWLVTAGRGEDAREAFAVIARWNGTTAPHKIAVVQKQEKSEENAGCRCNVELFSGWSGTHLFFLGGLYLSMNVGYYGFSAASAELGSAFFSLAWVAISGIPAFYFVAECYERYGKRFTNVVCFGSAAIFSMLCIFLSDLPRQICAGLGLFFVTMVFSGIYQYTNDLFTTSMRGSANGVCGFIGKYDKFRISNNFSSKCFIVFNVLVKFLLIVSNLQQEWQCARTVSRAAIPRCRHVHVHHLVHRQHLYGVVSPGNQGVTGARQS